MIIIVVDVTCQRCGRDDRLDRVIFTRTQMRAFCQCGHVYVVEIAPDRSLDFQCSVLEANPLVRIGPRER